MIDLGPGMKQSMEPQRSRVRDEEDLEDDKLLSSCSGKQNKPNQNTVLKTEVFCGYILMVHTRLLHALI